MVVRYLQMLKNYRLLGSLGALSLFVAGSINGQVEFATPPEVLTELEVSTTLKVETEEKSFDVSAYRVRLDASLPLNDNSGWAATESQPAKVSYDYPFRLRVEVESEDALPEAQELRLQYRNDGDWKNIGVSDFPYPLYATPPVSVISSAGYEHGEESENLLTGSKLRHEDGIGLSKVSSTPLFQMEPSSMEWEWPLVIRRYSDGPVFHADGARYEIRVVNADGEPLGGSSTVQLELAAKPGHLGGTFIETPAGIGPYQSSRGLLYFLMEPTETDNRFMVVASLDGGRSWQELDGENRPEVGDLEGVGAVFLNGVIHILHQTSNAVYYHAFATDDAPFGGNAGWFVKSEILASPSEPPTQVAALTWTPDGGLLGVYGTENGGMLHSRTQEGVWSDGGVDLVANGIDGLSGFQIATSTDGFSYLVYSAQDGTGWLRVIENLDTISAPILVSDSLGTEEEANGAFLPILTPDSGGAVVIYRKADGTLWERQYAAGLGLSKPRQAASDVVVTGIVDSDQVGADAIAHGNNIHVIYIDEETRSLKYTSRLEGGEWTPARVAVGNIEASWVRGALLRAGGGRSKYGFVYDAGSKGGSGMNRFALISLD